MFSHSRELNAGDELRNGRVDGEDCDEELKMDEHDLGGV